MKQLLVHPNHSGPAEDSFLVDLYPILQFLPHYLCRLGSRPDRPERSEQPDARSRIGYNNRGSRRPMPRSRHDTRRFDRRRSPHRSVSPRTRSR